ncbi:MAG: HYR domain-containing protein [Kiritimatiellae bacterium]|nr:HYR domain-containing protein [Kiritimatiellia bacterium]
MKTLTFRVFLGVVMGLCLVAGATWGTCVGDEEVAGEWIFEEEADGWAVNTGFNGDVGNLGLTGGAAFSTNVPPVNCDCGHSLFLPGTNGVAGAVSINDYDPLAGEEKFSILAWVRRDSADGANLSARIFSDADSTALTNTTAGVEFRFSGNAGNLALRINGTEVSSTVGGISPTNGEWHHVAVVYDGTRAATSYATRNVHFYVDGIQRGVGSVLKNAVAATNYAPVVVGNASPSRTAANLLAGNVDDVLVIPGWAPAPSGNGSANAAIQCFMNSADDIFPPTVTAPADVEAEAGECLAPVAMSLGSATAWDDCRVVLVTNDAPAVFAVGLTEVTWSAFDAAGNVATDTQSVSVVPSRTFDCDSDGLTDYEEVVELGTDATLWDTDGDGMGDGDEVAAGFDPLVPAAAAEVRIVWPADGRRLP